MRVEGTCIGPELALLLVNLSWKHLFVLCHSSSDSCSNPIRWERSLISGGEGASIS